MLAPTIFETHEQMSAAAASWLAGRIQEKPDALLCLATGSTPTRAYELLAAQPRELFEKLRVLKLDEWGGIPMSSPATCETYLRNILIEPLHLQSRYVGFESDPPDRAAECRRIASWLEQNGPIDICVLGLGINGHLGFNEPAGALQPHAHIAELSVESLQHSMVQQLPKKPTFGITLGIDDLLASREILLVVSGASKAGPMKRLMDGEISAQFPASYLAKHSRATILCDRASANEIS